MTSETADAINDFVRALLSGVVGPLIAFGLLIVVGMCISKGGRDGCS